MLEQTTETKQGACRTYSGGWQPYEVVYHYAGKHCTFGVEVSHQGVIMMWNPYPRQPEITRGKWGL